MHAQAFDLPREAIPELHAAREVHRVGATEERQETHFGAAARQLARQLEGDRAAGAEPGDDARARLARGADLAGEIAGELFHAREWRASAVEARGLQPEERLIGAEGARQRAVAEHVAVVAGHPVDRRPAPATLERHH